MTTTARPLVMLFVQDRRDEPQDHFSIGIDPDDVSRLTLFLGLFDQIWRKCLSGNDANAGKSGPACNDAMALFLPGPVPSYPTQTDSNRSDSVRWQSCNIGGRASPLPRPANH